jgi:hypothetical protein
MWRFPPRSFVRSSDGELEKEGETKMTEGRKNDGERTEGPGDDLCESLKRGNGEGNGAETEMTEI